jgi:hypothetical protein
MLLRANVNVNGIENLKRTSTRSDPNIRILCLPMRSSAHRNFPPTFGRGLQEKKIMRLSLPLWRSHITEPLNSQGPTRHMVFGP